MKTKGKMKTMPKSRCGCRRSVPQQIVISRFSGVELPAEQAAEAVEALAQLWEAIIAGSRVFIERVRRSRRSVVGAILPQPPMRTTTRDRVRGPRRLRGGPSTRGVRDRGKAVGKTAKAPKKLTVIFDNRSKWGTYAGT